VTERFSAIKAPWLFDDDVQSLLSLLSQQGGDVRIVGGAVRNTLLHAPVDDIDIATTWKPWEVIQLVEQAGFQYVPTGINFGTVTVIINHRPFEVTSLRCDLSSNGRQPQVVFGQDWHKDAQRRDFTINALYCDAEGVIYDEVGGLEDIKTRQIRFIGAPNERIREDYLRILRFFRFFAYYGEGRPHADALRAIVGEREGISRLSPERVWSEFKKLLRAPNPHRSLLWMRQSGVLSLILPESEKWGIDLIAGLIEAEQACAFIADPLSRLMAMIPPDAEKIRQLAQRLKLAKWEKKRVSGWASLLPFHASIDEADLRKILYQSGRETVLDHLRLSLAANRLNKTGNVQGEWEDYKDLFRQVENWQQPQFPLSGRDLIGLGLERGEPLGRLLTRLEADWVMSDFTLTKDQLLAKVLLPNL